MNQENEIRTPIDEQAFRAIYDAHVRRVRSILYRHGNANDVDDLTQETFTRVWFNIDRLKKGSSLSSWIFRIAVNVARDRLRADRRRIWMLWKGDDISDEICKDQVPFDLDTEIDKSLSKAINSLSPKLREPLILFSVDDIGIKQISEILNISEGTVKSRLFLARKKIAAFLKKEDEYEQKRAIRVRT
ncbi:MAG: RNA polymerase sigma factor [Oligoflexales bacterium]|nr:RNA polymerase sigma factor [Oligoflexales bacterium]